MIARDLNSRAVERQRGSIPPGWRLFSRSAALLPFAVLSPGDGCFEGTFGKTHSSDKSVFFDVTHDMFPVFFSNRSVAEWYPILS